MKDAVTQRVIEFLESKNITPNAVSESLDISQQALSKQLYGDGKGVTLTTIVGLLTTFQDLSAEWLLRGEGSMKKGEEWKVTEFVPVLNNDLIDALNRNITLLEKVNAMQEKEIGALMAEKKAAASRYAFVAADESLTKDETENVIQD